MEKLKAVLESAKEIVKLAKEREQVKKDLLCEEFGLEPSRCNSTTSEDVAATVGEVLKGTHKRKRQHRIRDN